MARHTRGGPLVKEVVMLQEIGYVLGQQATNRLATSALPYAPVLSESPRRRHAVTRRLRNVLARRGHDQA
jgi:hypothetical protein